MDAITAQIEEVLATSSYLEIFVKDRKQAENVKNWIRSDTNRSRCIFHDSIEVCRCEGYGQCDHPDKYTGTAFICPYPKDISKEEIFERYMKLTKKRAEMEIEYQKIESMMKNLERSKEKAKEVIKNQEREINYIKTLL